jgi:hypothetical protein
MGSMPGIDMSNMNMSAGATGGGELVSWAGQAPANADALAKRHVPMNATLPPAPAGPVARVHLVLVDKMIEIAPGIKYTAWAFSGGAPPFMALAACAFSTYLVFVQLHLIGAVCELCLVSDGLIFIATALAILRLRPEA